MNSAKIHLSQEELSLVKNAQLILTKNIIIEKVYVLFGSLSVEMSNEINKSRLPEAVMHTSPKIAKGEKHQGLPYVMLDYPRLFTKENVFAVRTFFWWANYFSMTLHLKGEYRKNLVGSIQKNIFLLTENNFYLSISEDEWEHDIDGAHYDLLENFNEQEIQERLFKSSFVKLSAKIDLEKWNESESSLMHLFKVIVKSLGS